MLAFARALLPFPNVPDSAGPVVSIACGSPVKQNPRLRLMKSEQRGCVIELLVDADVLATVACWLSLACLVVSWMFW